MRLRIITATLLASASFATHAATYCIHNAPGLQFALNQAMTNGENDVIKIVAGTLPVDDLANLSFSSGQDNDLYLFGGYDDTCTTLVAPGAKSTFIGTGNKPLTYLAMYGASLGKIVIQRVVWQNGSADATRAAVEINTSGSLLIQQAAFLDLHGGTNRPHAIEIRAQGSFDVFDSIFARNISGETSGTEVIYFYSSGTGTAHISNNTLTDNHGVNGVTSALRIDGVHTWSVANNILYANGTIYSLKLPANTQLRFNDIDYYAGTPALSTGNVTADPQFAASHDYHLAGNSPLINAGFNAVPEGLGIDDYDDNPRVVSIAVDIGAYEWQDVIFANGFESPSP